MSSSHKQNGPPDIGSWIFTIIMLFVFWPVGIFMLIGRLREAAKYSGSLNDRTTNAHRQTARPSPQKAEAQKQQTPRETAPKGASISARAFARLKKEQSSTNSISVVVLIAAIIGLFTGAVALMSGVSELFSGVDALNDILLGGFFALGGAVMLVVRSLIPRRVKLRRRYLAFLGDKEAVKLADFAVALARSPDKVQNDLQEMIDDGYFGANAYIDEAMKMLILDSSAADSFRRETEKPQQNTEETISEYDRILRELQSVNNRITDASISYKIERIESTCAKIFRAVEENPEKLPQIRRFMSYYLPTTLKLLRSYATLERQGIQGENIASTKESINTVLSKLVSGFDQQLDQLFRADAMDISADIEVLQSMMAQDGLTDSGPMAQASSGEIVPGYFETK